MLICHHINAFFTKATIGIDFLSKTMYLEDKTVRLQLCKFVLYAVHFFFAMY